MRDVRAQALEKIASLSAASSAPSLERSDIDQLCRACHSAGRGREMGQKSLGRAPMSIREFEVLLALCKSAPRIQSSQSAQRLSYLLIPYILDAHSQAFAPSPFFRRIEPSPTEALAFHVTSALLALGTNFGELRETVADGISSFLSSCGKAIERVVFQVSDLENPCMEDSVRAVTISLALLGFLDAASARADFWKVGSRMSLIQTFKHILSETFFVALETSLSTIRNSHSQAREAKDWRRLARHYHLSGRPLGAMLLQRSFMWLVLSNTALMIADGPTLRKSHILDFLMSGNGNLRLQSNHLIEGDQRSVELCASLAVEHMDYVEAGADFIQLGSPNQQRMAYSIKSAAMISFLNCSLVNDEIADPDILMSWLQETLEDRIQMADSALASVVLRCLALICRVAPVLSPIVSRVLPRFIVQATPHGDTVGVASTCLAYVLKTLSKDAVISTLYTLGNVLSPASGGIATNGQINGTAGGEVAPDNVYAGRHSTGSSISLLRTNGEEETAIVYGNVVQAICGIASACKDEKITALAQSMLLQKVDKSNADIETHVISGAGALGMNGGQLEFRALLKMYSRICHMGVVERKNPVLAAVMKARTHISANLRRDSPLFDIYWEHLLDSIISLGDVESSSHTKESDVKLVALEIGELLRPLAVFMASNDFASEPIVGDEACSLLRDAWFNIVVHGFTTTTDRGKRYLSELRTMAVHSPPLIAEERSEQVESDIELNTVLRRGYSNDREAAQKKMLAELIPSKAADIKGLSYRKVIFLQAAYLVESLRAASGDCTKVLSYFLEPSMRKGDVSSTMEGITLVVVDHYLGKTLAGADPAFSAHYAATQLATIFCRCCHRIERVQQAAFQCADRIVREAPSALCYRTSLFALLELLSLMWTSCLEAETDPYTPRSIFSSSLGNVTVELSDDFSYRRWTLDALHRKAKAWVTAAVNLAPLDIKGLLQTYLSEFDDEGAYGHVSLGRSFALELGSMMPSTDSRLQSLDRIGDCDINTGSDLIAQYTTRQEYRYGETLPERGIVPRASTNAQSGAQSSMAESSNASTALAHIEARILSMKTTPLSEVRDILRRAAALLCRSSRDEAAVARHLVSIPFALFTKQSIKLGVSLWLGVMNENPRLEPKLLNSIAQQWEFTITRKVGLFDPALTHPDPFFEKEEFAPSELEALVKRRQVVHDMLSPHTRLVQFFSSHYNATRLGSTDTQRVFLRMLDLTMDAMKRSTSHPMTRELHFQMVLFGLKVLRSSTTLGAGAQWRLKEKILSAGLAWFRNAPRWSFGCNIVQLRTEVRLISDVLDALKAVSFIGLHAIGNVQSLQSREQLLQMLLENEQSRLNVWIGPLDHHHNHHSHFSLHGGSKSSLETTLTTLARTAWSQDPAIAIELTTRFHLARLRREVRQLLLSAPERAVSEPGALPLMFGGHLPDDLDWQLKYLLYWEPTNPLTAVTMFLPDYKDQPFVIQYAMRALESHSVDVTFFYVPQIVQTLRYDGLGYVERFILETAQFSQLFAHQIIWNMKANSFKDDDAQVPDEIKPTLDRVRDKMVDSFAAEDKQFYEREFAFFDEVTSISGKLKPLIKRSKPEKKQKIEEELRKIKVEVGVYLPSNPDGVVIGIDRKSGKPLQSHAKAPYMATFRIRKQRPATDEETAAAKGVNGSRDLEMMTTTEVWQSAIFKVGDDCRQDVLALQMIAAFRGIFHSVGLDVYVFPYRVTATAPGCGVIDVLPNSISRDMLGREAVNGLYDYFVSRYGNEDSLRFQRARNNFIKSMAAYSVISFLLQFKDRHNGNIMIDDAGHILHIDFGFCFDIAPGGIKFERAPFKLTAEMVAVMGGSSDHQSFRWFEELCVRAFLASRLHVEELSQLVRLMADSGLPCFKPETVGHFRERFVVERGEREAAEFMKDLIRKSYSSYSTGIYDQFQLLTNGIPF
ncbi:hypothetical protein CDD80_2386 [Ophiocordyceps camponoti-rufipedis]|uniref:1-phosphatidylinositol 4-kinase n=1 Tax=Ophiocordyceps camponoti-rufipedis TaxID=2004952 RepID=A0A2C5Z6R1_9HYPO|nr:hypothetical protein CDD80_2386 [Ophiocordyceps camponoti-rufipedis]